MSTKRVDLRIVATDEAGRAVTPSPSEQLSAVLKALHEVLETVPLEQQLVFAQGMQKIFGTPEVAKAVAAATAAEMAEIGVLHLPIRGGDGRPVAVLDLTGARAKAMLKKIGATITLPDGSEADIV